MVVVAGVVPADVQPRVTMIVLAGMILANM